MSTTGEQSMEINAYEGHPELTQLEAEVLWEYAKFAKQVKQLLTMTRELSEAPDQAMLGKLRELERKFGFVLTLFKASVWGAINDAQQAAEEEDDDGEYSYEDERYGQTITR